MLPVKRMLEIFLVLLIILSGLLLGLSQGDLRLSFIAAVGAIAGLLICDIWGFFRIRGWLANVASILVLLYAMKDFMGEGSAVKLIAVSNLLVYLQTVLMFQEKTPRLVWQVMVMSLLQVVVAAIFNLNFEGGMLFLFYFALAGITMALQHIWTEKSDLVARNQASAKSVAASSARARNNGVNQPAIVFFDVADQSLAPVGRMVWHLSAWLIAGLLFTTIMFYVIPRNKSAWFGPRFGQARGTGSTHTVNTDLSGVRIEQSGELAFRAWFEDTATEERIELAELPYFRGMAMSSLVIDENGNTAWKAPHDRIYPSLYESAPRPPRNGRKVKQVVSLEPTDDPLLYSCMPVYRSNQTGSFFEFCHEISAYTRRRQSDRIELSPFKYETLVHVSASDRPYESWPYVANVFRYNTRIPMSEDQGQRRWLTSIDQERYPGLVATANDIAAKIESGTSLDLSVGLSPRLRLSKALESWFLDPSRFQYTLDFTDVVKTEGVDPIEDFTMNSRRGHCELFASSLTLMLRSQNIPARYVVGFHGGEFNELTKMYMVRNKHAHAWVEVYLRPEDCSPDMLVNGKSGLGGAWYRLDPTPPTNLEDTSAAIDLARSFWQDYVLGLDSTNQLDLSSKPSSRFLGLMDLSTWGGMLSNAGDEINRRPMLRIGLVGGALLGLFGLIYFSSKRRRKKKGRRGQVSLVRRAIASAISLISPELARWVGGESQSAANTLFYRKLSNLLQKQGQIRDASQTHREFATQVCEHFALHDKQATIANSINEITNRFYEVRFGGRTLDAEGRGVVERSLSELEQSLSS